MLPQNLRTLISDPSAFLQKKFPNRKTDGPEKLRYEVLNEKFQFAQALLDQGHHTVAALCRDINVDIKARSDEKQISAAEKKRLNPWYEGSQQSWINTRQLYRLADPNEKCPIKDAYTLMVYLEIPPEEHDMYLAGVKETTAPARTPDEKNGKTSKLHGSWNAYIYNPRAKAVNQLPVVIEKINAAQVRVHVKAFGDTEYKGIAEFYDDHLVCTMLNPERKKPITLYTCIDDVMLAEDTIINAGCTWLGNEGKPIMSVLLLTRAKRQYQKDNLPKGKGIEFKQDGNIQTDRVNHLIEYVSRKGEPELAPRWFRPNTFEVLMQRNSQSRINIQINRPRDEFHYLSRFFAEERGNGQWFSLSRIHRGALANSVSVFKCAFSADHNRKVVFVQRNKRLPNHEKEYDGIVQYKQQHVSIHFTSDNGYKHLLCPLPSQRLEDDGEAGHIVLLGSSSTLHENTSYLIKEMLVYTEGIRQHFIDRGAIPLEDFMKLDFLTAEQKQYLAVQDEAVMYKMKAE